MDPVTLLTILGLVIAVYAIISPERKLDFRLRLNWLDWVIISLSTLILHYITFFPVFSNLGLTVNLGYYRWGFDPSNTSYLIILISTIIIFIRIRYAPLRRSKIRVFSQLTERLLQESKYSDLMFLLENHHSRLFRIYQADFLLPLLRKKLTPSVELIINNFGDDHISKPLPNFTTRIKSTIFILGSRIALLLPSGDNFARVAEDIIRRILLAEDFVEQLAKTRPYFGLKLLDYEFWEREDFLQLYGRKLLEYKLGVFYFEIRNNQNISSHNRYIIDDRNRFISYFLKDAKIAEGLGIWKPFGDYVCDYLDFLYRDPKNDPYNESLDNYAEDGRWQCSIYATIRFFDIMIPEALHQGIQWHMWLYYFTQFTSRIIRNLSPKPSVDLDREWPTPYHYLLYEMVSALSDWIETVQYVSPDQANVKLENTRVDHENGNIPKSAILAMGQILHYMIKADVLDNKFKTYILDIVLRSVRDLSTQDATKPYGLILQNSILSGGHQYRSNDKLFLDNINTVFSRIDHVLQSELKDFEQALTEKIAK